MDKVLIFSLIVLSILKFSDCEDCVFKNTCECVFRNGSVIDLNTLGSHNKFGYRRYALANLYKQSNTGVDKIAFCSFGPMKATNLRDNFTYYYNPCYPFKLGKTGDCAKGVAVCQVSADGNSYYDCGDANSVNFNVEKNIVTLIYSATSRQTNVTLICAEDAVTPELTVLGELSQRQYVMSLKTKCACPDLCKTSHLSTGSVLLILFMIFVSLYLLLGIVHSRLTRGAQGWELIPHYEFWSEFPLLVRDGCVFVVNGCKAETAYERI